MPIPLEAPRVPPLRFREVQQQVIGHVCHIATIPWMEYGGGGRQRFTPEGKGKFQDRLRLLVVSGTAVIPVGEGEARVDPGDVVDVYISGHHRWDWGQAKKQHAGGLNVGDVLRIVYTGDAQGQGAAPKKVWAFALRAAKPTEAEQVNRAEQIYRDAELATVPARNGIELEPEEEEEVAIPW